MAERRTLLLVDDGGLDAGWSAEFRACQEFQVIEARAKDDALSLLRSSTVHVVAVVTREAPADDEHPFSCLRDMRTASPSSHLILAGCSGDRETISRAVAEGASDILPAPARPWLLALRARRAIQTRRLEEDDAVHGIGSAPRPGVFALKGSSAAIRQVRAAVEALADSAIPVLVRGERGTGRRFVAHALHLYGGRRDRPFVRLSCSAFPRRFLEAELFGRGAGDPDEGALVDPGCLARAAGGTFLLEAPRSLAPGTQERLLRWIRASPRPPSGAEGSEGHDVRFVTTGSKDFHRDHKGARLHRDLARWLSAAVIDVPPLRERRADIPFLAERFLDRFCKEGGTRRKHLTREAMECLGAHAWPGNLRELEHTIESTALLCREETIEPRHLPKAIQDHGPSPFAADVALPPGGVVLQRQVAEFEKALLVSALERAGGRKSEAAQMLGLNRDQMKYLCRKHNL